MSIENLVRTDLKNFVAYSSAKSKKLSGNVWLNANESPFDSALNRYPEPQPEELTIKLAHLYNVRKNNIVITRGSDEAIDLLIRLFCKAYEDSIITCPPTFGMYDVLAKLQGINNKEIPLLHENFELSVEAILQQISKKDKLLFLCSPNNPTGNILPLSNITKLCENLGNRMVIVVDEAYIEFSNEQSLTQLINQYENLVVLRTLSKAYGLAGLRCGCLLAQSTIVNWIKKIMPPYPIASIVSNVAIKAIDFHNTDQITMIIEQREIMLNKLRKISCIQKVWPSEGNFLLLQCSQAEEVMSCLQKAGIVVRRIQDSEYLNHAIRITIGTPQENESVIDVLKSMTNKFEGKTS